MTTESAVFGGIRMKGDLEMKVRMRRIEQGSLFCALVLGTALTLSPGCGSSNSCPAGTLNCACTSVGGCNAGLSCSAGICVQGPANCGAVSPACAQIATDPCGTCLAQCCCAELVACATSTSCYNLLQCEAGCTTSSCNDSCVSAYPAGETKMDDYLNCGIMSCTTECG
jgi:hypothetical protein